MIYAFICTKPSVRCPGKNDRLLPYTIAWLGYAAMWLEEPLEIVHIGEGRPAALPPAIRHIEFAAASHKEVLAEAMRACSVSPTDICVLPQLTQPLRNKRLLSVVVSAARITGQTTITAALMPQKKWRRLDARGRWGQKPATENEETLIDGVLYAWQGMDGLADVFDPTAQHTVISTLSPLLIDIDHPEDFPPALSALWAETLIQ